MTAGWVAASVRADALLRRLVGADGARSLAEAATWREARTQLASTFYGGELSEDADRANARRTAMTATIWQLRVLGGWLPVGGSGVTRLFAAPFEIANIEGQHQRLAGVQPMQPVPLGSLALAWPRAATTNSVAELRTVLARSAWGDPGGGDLVDLGVGLRIAWARRLLRQVPELASWVKGGLAVLVAREVFAFERQIPPATAHELDRLVGTGWCRATTIPELHHRLPDSAAWALTGISTTTELWRAELAVARRITREATEITTAKRFTKTTVAAMMTLMLIDLWRINAAIELAGRGPSPSEVLDAVA